MADIDGKTEFIFADQSLDRSSSRTVPRDRDRAGGPGPGLLAPGAVTLADLNGDGIPDLIVANSGGNNVLVYPGLGHDTFGPELNGGRGFSTGTNPVGITVANLNGRPDLIIANKGSNDVSILLNTPEGTVSRSSQAPAWMSDRVRPGLNGPHRHRRQFPSLVVSDSASDDLRVLPRPQQRLLRRQPPDHHPAAQQPGPVSSSPAPTPPL